MGSCSVTRHLSEDKFLLTKNEVGSADGQLRKEIKDWRSTQIIQKPNTKWFSFLSVPLGIYSLAGNDTTTWAGRVLRGIGQAPAVFDSVKSIRSCEHLLASMKSVGHLRGRVEFNTLRKGKKLKAIYTLHPHERFELDTILYGISDDMVAKILNLDNAKEPFFGKGEPFSIELLNRARNRITDTLRNHGYYKFYPDNIRYHLDTVAGSNRIDLTLLLVPHHHSRYKIGKVEYNCIDGNLREKVLKRNNRIVEGEYYKEMDFLRTSKNFGRLQAVESAKIEFEPKDSNLLDCKIDLSMRKKRTISIQVDGTHTHGNVGIAGIVGYDNRNLFKGSEVLSLQGRVAWENIAKLGGYQNRYFFEWGGDARLLFPRFLFPFLSRNYKRNIQADSEFLLRFSHQDRPEFKRNVFSGGWRYLWQELEKNWTFTVDAIDVNYIHMPWIDQIFKENYLDNTNSRNAILRYNYEDIFVVKTGFGVKMPLRKHQELRLNFETAGNFMSLLSCIFPFSQNADGESMLFKSVYAQYLKFDVDYVKRFKVAPRTEIALHGFLGLAWPYGNSKILPFEKRYLSGGANSVRGWKVRGLGPGRFAGNNGEIDFINQTGDLKIDLNAEFRFPLFWNFYGALFVDAGNIWTFREYKEQPGGQFRLDRFYKEMACSYGLGLRLDLNYLLFRLDWGLKAVNPAYTTKEEHFPMFHFRYRRDRAWHLAIGLPF